MTATASRPHACDDWEVRAWLSGARTTLRLPVRPSVGDALPLLAYGGSLVLRWQEWTVSGQRVPGFQWVAFNSHDPHGVGLPLFITQGGPGDLIWVQEAWAPLAANDGTRAGGSLAVRWRASDPEPSPTITWSPADSMPRWASRLTLRVLRASVGRLQRVTRDEVASELGDTTELSASCRRLYASLWDRQHGRKAPYGANPWVVTLHCQPLIDNVDAVLGGSPLSRPAAVMDSGGL